MAKSQEHTINKSDLKYPSRFNVVILNDDFTPMDFVIQLLVELFNKTLEQAQDITMTVHDKGKGIAGTYNFEIAEQKKGEATIISRNSGHPLTVVVEEIE